MAELPPTGDDTATDLGILVARTEIVDGLSAFCSAMDAASYDAAAGIFTDDCVTDYRPSAGGAVLGKAAFRVRVQRSQADSVQTHHQFGQVQVSIEPESARSVADLAAYQTSEGARIDAYMPFHDEWVRLEGRWRIRRRVAHFDVVVVDGGARDRRWTVRRRP